MTTKSATYKGHEIIKTDAVCLSENNKPLYGVRGRFEKPAQVRPFLTSEMAAKRWISERVQ